jgi:predicted dehydrogenase
VGYPRHGRHCRECAPPISPPSSSNPTAILTSPSAFTKDLLTNPTIRSVHDVAHTVAAAASSSSASRAKDFLNKVSAPSTAKAYGSYAELVADPDVDIIYVATPHSHHFQNAMLALSAGKNVLCEKALTVNAAQARKLFETAKAKGVFLMEAVWTRYFPLSIKIREMVRGGEIGQVVRVVADLSFANARDDGRLSFEDLHRMVNMELAGGALLDLGIYSLTWVFQILYHCQEKPRERPTVLAAINKYERTGCDEMTTMVLQFPKHQSMGIAMTGLRAGYAGGKAYGPSITITGTKGEIQVTGPAYRPTSFKVIMNSNPGDVNEFDYPIPTDSERGGWGHGMYWEADEVARCLRDGKHESEGIDWEESTVIMETMDEVRRQGGLKYPDMIESSEFDPNSPLNLGRSYVSGP